MSSSKRPVVVAVPRGRTVRPALKHAVAVGAPSGAAYVLVHALATDEARASDAQAIHDLHRAEQQLRALAGPGAHITTRLVDGPVVAAVVRVAEDAELLVVQRRDRHDPEQPVGRSTSCDLAARSHVPVVVVPEEHDDLGHGTVTVGIQAPEHSDVVLEEAMAAAAVRGARLRVVHGLWAAGGLGEYLVEQSTADRHLASARAAVEAAVARTGTRWPTLPVEVDVLRADPVDALLLESNHSDLLVVERHDPVLPVGVHLGSVADAVVRDARCPVMVVAPTHRHRRSRSDRSDQSDRSAVAGNA
jgi:nucleotide-binding universal stress UspA family protein